VIGGVLIIVLGVISFFLLLPAERRSLESIAGPLTAVDPEPATAPRVPALR
jgi:hypothetical protein